MPNWLKALSMIVGLGGWLATVIVSLMRGELPDATTLGVPVALMVALAPPVTITRGQDTGNSPSDEAEQAP